MADQRKPLDIDAARARLRDARARVDRLPDHAKRGILPPETTTVLLDALGDLGRALDRVAELERACPPPERLRMLADWLDLQDASHASDYRGDEVQRDLRRLADALAAEVGGDG